MKGSPPQVRGKLYVFERLDIAFRITPAGAGKTLPTHTTPTYTQDHPRRCGENPAPETALERLAGSPPQVRGKQGISP